MILDTKRTFDLLDNTLNADYCRQDGKIFSWSESNIRYEHAWWLTDDGWPINDSEHVCNIMRDRPFNREWLNNPAGTVFP